MDVSVSTPRLNVHVWSWDGAEYDIHDDIISVETQKQLGQPAGTWSVMLTSKRDSFSRTWAKRIRPQDYCEIYGSRTALPNETQTIIMRGFVDNAYEDIIVSPNNQVQRVVRINGRDFGKVLLTRQMVFAEEINPLALTLDPAFVLAERLGLGADGFAMSPTEFLGRIKTLLFNDPTIGATQPNPRVPKLQAFTDIPAEHQVQFLNMTPKTGSVWTTLKSYEGAPFNELFVRDDDNFPRLYWRLAPLHNKAGQVANAATTDATTSVSLADIISENVGTSGNEAFCVFLTLPTFMEQGGFSGFPKAVYITPQIGGDLERNVLDPFDTRSGTTVTTVTAGNPVLRKDIFNKYGFQILETGYPLFPVPSVVVGQQGFASNLSAWLHNVYSWNPIQESGSITIRGNPSVRVGQHINITEQSRQFYVEGVNQSFSIWPSPKFETNMQVTRGLWTKNSPYPETDWI